MASGNSGADLVLYQHYKAKWKEDLCAEAKENVGEVTYELLISCDFH